jgi:hypothetical protein
MVISKDIAGGDILYMVVMTDPIKSHKEMSQLHHQL